MLDLSAQKPKLLVIGDALEDIYFRGSWYQRSDAHWRFYIEEKLSFAGGAANTLANARAILDGKADVHSWMNEPALPLFRYVDYVEDEIRESYIQTVGADCLQLPQECSVGDPDVIIISDYNKGTVNKPCPKGIKQAKWLIVDSRYRTVHPSWFELGKRKIWRCTDKEFDLEWVKNFDVLVHTAGPKEVRVAVVAANNYYENPLSESLSWPVPRINVVDTCGAGDTFTAMLAAKLLFNPFIDEAIPDCIRAAQEVCLKPYTAITTQKV